MGFKGYQVSESIDAAVLRAHDLHAKYKAEMIIELRNPERAVEYFSFCEQFSKHTEIDGLGGPRSTSGWRRESTGLSLGEVLHLTPTGIATGLKVYVEPRWKLEEWEQWPAGYLENFTRMAGNEDWNELFIWQKIPMVHLREILEKFQDDMVYYYG